MDGDWWYKCIVIVVLLSDSSVFNLWIGDLKPNANTCTCWSTRYKGYTVGQDAEVNTHSTLPRGTVYLQVNDCACTVAYNINVFTCKLEYKYTYIHLYLKCAKAFLQVSIHGPDPEWPEKPVLDGFTLVVVGSTFGRHCCGSLQKLQCLVIVSGGAKTTGS